ncbi:MAG: GrpB family protein, partial [bacterium]|nr:GrpB family protein [bacterium]
MTVKNMNEADNKLERIKLLRELMKKCSVFQGVSIREKFQQFQRARAPRLDDAVLTLSPYDPNWPELYASQKNEILGHLETLKVERLKGIKANASM